MTKLPALTVEDGSFCSSVADPWHFGVDPDEDPDPSIFINDLQDANKKIILKKEVFLHITF
jgi:hypothetical protein